MYGDVSYKDETYGDVTYRGINVWGCIVPVPLVVLSYMTVPFASMLITVQE
jgi:hypothetical protein